MGMLQSCTKTSNYSQKYSPETLHSLPSDSLSVRTRSGVPFVIWYSEAYPVLLIHCLVCDIALSHTVWQLGSFALWLGHIDDLVQDCSSSIANALELALWLWYIDGLVQDCCNSIADALELLQSCTKPSTYLSFCMMEIMHLTLANRIHFRAFYLHLKWDMRLHIVCELEIWSIVNMYNCYIVCNMVLWLSHYARNHLYKTTLTHWGWDKMADISQMTSSNFILLDEDILLKVCSYGSN